MASRDSEGESSPSGEATGGESGGAEDRDTRTTGAVEESGPVGDDDDDDMPSVQDCTAETPPVGESLMRRLTRVEYGLSLQELLRLEAPPDVSVVPEDPNEEGFRTIATLNSLSAQHLRGYITIAEALAGDLMADPARRDAVLGCAPDSAQCLPSFVESFGRLAFRRPLSQEEVTGYVEAAQAASLDQEDAFRFALEALLISPNFIFRVEGSGPPGELTTLNDHELASRLSFAVWGRGPSSELLDAADRGELSTTEGLIDHAEQLLADPRSQVFFASFFEQWLGFEYVREPTEAPAGWYPGITKDLQAETHNLMRDVAWSNDRPLFDVFTANETRITPQLATFYGIEVDADGRATFTAESPRSHSGILTHPAVLSAKSDGDLVSKRGAWFRRTFLCQTFEVPPGLFETLGDRLVGLTYFEILAERNRDTACAGCHAMLDPIGVGLVSWDMSGLFDPSVDTAEYGIDPSIPGIEASEFTSAAELGQKLAQIPAVQTCLSERIFLYTHGREADSRSGEHLCSVEQALERFSETGRFKDLLIGILLDEQFRYRKNPA